MISSAPVADSQQPPPQSPEIPLLMLDGSDPGRLRTASAGLSLPLRGSMHPNAALIERFYTAFAARDAAGMQACYHPDVVFSDAAFGELRGAEAGAMWAMLLERGKDLRVTFSGVHADDAQGGAHWDADYTFSQSGRPVHNRIDAEFAFRDGL